MEEQTITCVVCRKEVPAAEAPYSNGKDGYCEGCHLTREKVKRGLVTMAEVHPSWRKILINAYDAIYDPDKP